MAKSNAKENSLRGPYHLKVKNPISEATQRDRAWVYSNTGKLVEGLTNEQINDLAENGAVLRLGAWRARSRKEAKVVAAHVHNQQSENKMNAIPQTFFYYRGAINNANPVQSTSDVLPIVPVNLTLSGMQTSKKIVINDITKLNISEAVLEEKMQAQCITFSPSSEKENQVSYKKSK